MFGSYIRMVATAMIEAREEIFADYGEGGQGAKGVEGRRGFEGMSGGFGPSRLKIFQNSGRNFGMSRVQKFSFSVCVPE